MKINLTKKQYEKLIELLGFADWMLNSMKTKPIERYSDIFQYLLKYRKDFHQEESIGYFKDSNEYYFSDKLMDKLMDKVEEYDENIFWETLVDKFVKRDIAKTDNDIWDKMSPDDRFKLMSELEDECSEEFIENNFDNVKILKEDK